MKDGSLARRARLICDVRQKMISAIIGASLAFVFSAWLGVIVFKALRSGVARIAGGREFKRKKSALMYWTAVSVQSLFSIAMLAVGIMRLARI